MGTLEFERGAVWEGEGLCGICPWRLHSFISPLRSSGVFFIGQAASVNSWEVGLYWESQRNNRA